MCALQISELDQLMTNESRIPIRNHEVPLSLPDIDSGCQLRRPVTGRVESNARRNECAVAQLCSFSTELNHGLSNKDARAAFRGFVDEVLRCARGIDYCVRRNAQSPSQAGPKARVRLRTKSERRGSLRQRHARRRSVACV